MPALKNNSITLLLLDTTIFDSGSDLEKSTVFCRIGGVWWPCSTRLATIFIESQ